MDNSTGTSVQTVTVETWAAKRELFLVVWHSWTPADHEPDELRVWGIYSDEVSSQRALEEARRYEKHPSLVRGAFCWMRVDRVDSGPDWGELLMDFGVLKCAKCGNGFESKLHVQYTEQWQCEACSQ